MKGFEVNWPEWKNRLRQAAQRNLHRARDHLISSVALGWVRQKFAQFGSMLSLEIDSRKRTIQMQVQLKGEQEPIHIHVHQYRLIEEDGTTFLEFAGLKTSREWMDLVIGEFLQSRRLEVPRFLKAAL